MNKYLRREIVSLNGICPMGCKHCYSFDMQSAQNSRGIDEIIFDVKNSAADIVYVSGKNENYFAESDGYKFCERLYDECKKDLFIITRSFLSDEILQNLSELNCRMKQNANSLYLAASVCANESYGITENPLICPAPDSRISNLLRASRLGIHTVLMVRPVFPGHLVPVKEYLDLVSKCEGTVDAVVISGLIVTDSILRRLGIQREVLNYLTGGDSTYLDDLNDDSISYVDVEAELKEIENKCHERSIPVYRHTMPALNAIAKAEEGKMN